MKYIRSVSGWMTLLCALFLVGGVSCSSPHGSSGGGRVVITTDAGGGADTDPTHSDPNCEPGQAYCSDECVDLKSDPLNCGSCSNRCADGQVCVNYVCQAQPGDCPDYQCPGRSYCDTDSGKCLPGCNDDSQCTGGKTCNADSHACACSDEQHVCGGQCVQSDAVQTCGDRCQPCATDPNGTASCVDGACQLACKSGYKLCNGTCAACPQDATETVCNGDQCVANACGQGARACQGQCVSCPSDPNMQSTECDGAQCVLSTCTSGYHVCGGACVSGDSVDHCGDSCQACPTDPNGTASCDRQTCHLQCNAGAHRCANGCCMWSAQTIDTVGSTVTAASIAIDSQGNPWVAYATKDSAELKVAHWDGSQWQIDSVDTDVYLSQYYDTGPHIAIGPADKVFVEYPKTVGTSSHEVDLAERNGASWTTGVIGVSGIYADNRVSLKVDSAGAPHLAYMRSMPSGQSYGVGYAVRNGSTWNDEVVNSDTGSFGGRPSLALDSNDQPHIAYFDANDYRLYYAVKSGSQWSREDVGSGGYDNSIAIDDQGRVGIVFTDISPGTVYYASPNSSGWWDVESIDPIYEDGLTLAFDAAGHRHVGYANRDSHELDYVRPAASGWDVQSIDVAGTTADSPAMAVTPAGDAMFVFHAGNDLKLVR